MDMLCLIGDILEWGREKNIDNPRVQLKKECEETLEAQEALTCFSLTDEHDDYKHLVEEVGDIGVVWLLLCQSLDIDPADALEAAHNKNKDRTGKTINGNFIKDEEL